MAERVRAQNSCSGGLVIGVWVRIPAVTLVSLSSMYYFLLFTQGHKWLPTGVEVYIVNEKAFGATRVEVDIVYEKAYGATRVEVDIVYEKAFGAPRQLGAVYSPGS